MAGYNFSIKVEGATELKNALFLSPQIADKVETQMLQMAALMITGKAKELAPRNKSVMAGSIAHKAEGGYGNRAERVGTNIEYAVFQEYGTGIYGYKGQPITPKRAPYLVFKTKDGKWVRAKSVRGVPKKEFMKKAIEYYQSKKDTVIAKGNQLFKQYFFRGYV